MIGVASDESLLPASIPAARPAPRRTEPLRARAFAAAARHSRRVRLLKLAIPLGSAGAAALILAATMLNPFGNVPGLSLGSLSLNGSKIAMEGPKLTGFRKDAKPYEVTATAAFQDVRKPNVIELKDMKAKLGMDEAGGLARLASRHGVFDTTKEHLELKDDIRITTDRGDEVLLRSASVDFKAGTVVSREPLTITTAQGSIEAEGVHVSDNGRTLAFTGRVRTQFDGRLATSPAPAAKTGASPSPVAKTAAPAAPAAATVAAPAALPAAP
ncbi:MAG: LPS export ABC transporter periplasmic protein LptC, partial [Methylobacteriaceae bacterium]|nr:LPS export ABC transporter periplasmic protein LptC [Methylobacteriaceae bacterium]